MKYRHRSDEEMKDSGVEWIGKIPNTWDTIKGKFLYENNKLKNNGKIENVLSLTLNGVIDRDVNNYEGLQPDSFDSYQEFYADNLVFKLIDLENISTSRVGYVHKSGLMSPAYIRLEKKKNVNSKFYYYNYFNYYNQNIYNFLGSVGVRSALNSSDLLEMDIMHINKEEQDKIAKFLDEKTAQFDSIISKKEALIQKLEEAKKSIISEVVTCKLKVYKTSAGYELMERKKEEIRDNGIEWLGATPINWELKAVKYLFQLRNERNIKEMSEVQLLSLFTSLGVMKQGEVEARGNKVRTVEDYKEVYPNDIVVNIILAWMGAIGMSEYRGVISPAYDIYKPINSYVNSKYYHYLFRTSRFAGECYKKGRGIMEMRWRTYSDEFKSIIVPFPSVEEQNDIVRFLDERVNSIDQLSQRINKQIEKLKEAKQSLISEVVTGKIEILD